jgi:hypothetical protein
LIRSTQRLEAALFDISLSGRFGSGRDAKFFMMEPTQPFLLLVLESLSPEVGQYLACVRWERADQHLKNRIIK